MVSLGIMVMVYTRSSFYKKCGIGYKNIDVCKNFENQIKYKFVS